MREQINNNPVVQIGLVAVLLLVAGFFFLSSKGGGGEAETEEPAASTSVTAPAEGAAEGEAAVSALPVGGVPKTPPRLPAKVLAAWHGGKTPVLLFVHDGGIDDNLVRRTTEALAGFEDSELFVVPAQQIAEYTAVTEGVELQRVPALIVITPERLDHGPPTASIRYGFQSPESVAQAMIDAGYRGPRLPYHP
jgi:hypothetical protein